MVENIAPWYHGAIWALREHCISYCIDLSLWVDSRTV